MGTLRNGENQGWMPISGKEYFTTQKPGFVWYAKAKPNAILWFSARLRGERMQPYTFTTAATATTLINAG
jgi:hypothetical protein